VRVDYKVPGGKLLRIDAEMSGDIIKSIRIHGDFFIHPEEQISAIERALVGKKIDDSLKKLLDEQTKDCRMIGVTTDAIAQALQRFKNHLPHQIS